MRELLLGIRRVLEQGWVCGLVCLAGLLPCALWDARKRRVPLEFLIWFIGMGSIAGLAHVMVGIRSFPALLAGLVPGLFLTGLAFISPGSIGLGDGICMLGMGLCLGLRQSLLVLGIALAINAVRAAAVFLRSRCGGMLIAFLPSLMVSCVLVFLLQLLSGKLG